MQGVCFDVLHPKTMGRGPKNAFCAEKMCNLMLQNSEDSTLTAVQRTEWRGEMRENFQKKWMDTFKGGIN
jgi:hypothetical protein